MRVVANQPTIGGSMLVWHNLSSAHTQLKCQLNMIIETMSFSSRHGMAVGMVWHISLFTCCIQLAGGAVQYWARGLGSKNGFGRRQSPTD